MATTIDDEDDYKEGDMEIVNDSPITSLDEFKEVSKVSDSYAPEGFKTAEDYLDRVRKDYDLDVQYDSDNRLEAIEDKKFAAGEQWDPQVLRHREGLPCLVINTVPQFTAQLVGDWRQNRNGIKVVPSDNGDVDVADVRADLIRAIELDSRATRVYDSAFESMVQCGDGAYQITVEYACDEVFDQVIRLRPIDDALSVVWDRTSIDPTGRDANHCFVDEPMTRDDFNDTWPDCDPSELSTDRYNDLRNGGWLDDSNDMVRVTAHWRMIERNHLLALFKDGFVTLIDKNANVPELQQKHGEITKTRLSPVRYAQMHIVNGYKILAGPFEYKLSRLPVIRMTGRVVNVNGRRIRHGLVRFLKDAARLKNFWRSVAAEQLGYAPKAQWLASQDAVDGLEDKFRSAHLKRDPLLIFNEGAEKPERISPPPIEAALLNEANVNTQDMKDVTGIQDASLGIKSNETSGKAIMARQREGDVASLTYYDNGNAAVLEGGDVINQLLSQIYDAPRVVRIIGEDEAIKLQYINDPFNPNSIDLSTGKYDVAISTGPSYTTRRVEAADAMMQAVQVWPQLISVAGDLVASAQDWPGSEKIAERLRKTIPPEYLQGETDEHGNPIQAGPTPEQIQQLQQTATQLHGENQKLTQENQTLKTQADLKFQQNQVAMFDSYTKRLEVLGKISERDSQGRMAAIPKAMAMNVGGQGDGGGAA